MVILRTRNKITEFFMILAWASPFKLKLSDQFDGETMRLVSSNYDRGPSGVVVTRNACHIGACGFTPHSHTSIQVSTQITYKIKYCGEPH